VTADWHPACSIDVRIAAADSALPGGDGSGGIWVQKARLPASMLRLACCAEQLNKPLIT
jgi:hypothetical protein